MQNYDIIMLALLAVATLYGFWRGMAWQIASLASLVASYFVSLHFSPQIAPLFGRQAPLNRFAAMLAIYLGTSLAIWMVFRLVRRFINQVRLTEFDRQAGALLGAAKGVLLCVAVTFFAVSLSAPAREAILKSRSGFYIARLLDQAEAVMPPELHQTLNPYLRKLDALDGATGPTAAVNAAAGQSPMPTNLRGATPGRATRRWFPRLRR
jgi:membrane protein required for colicin V production